MKLGISSWTYTWAVGVGEYRPPRPLTPFDLLDRADALGVRVLQVADNLPLDGLTAAELAAFGADAARRGITLEVGAKGLTVAHMRRYLEICGVVGARLLRVVIDSPGDEPEPDEVVARLHVLVPDLASAGVTLGIENHDRFTAQALAGMVQAAESPLVGICLDTVNSFGALEGPGVVVPTLAPYAVNLHLKDFTIRRAPQMMGFVIEGRPVGQGRTDVPWLLQTLAAHGRDVNAIIEQWTPSQGTVDETIALEARWAVESVAYARQFITA